MEGHHATLISAHSMNTVRPVDTEGPLLVIGAGLARTGTLTLKTALEILYGRPCYHMKEIVMNHSGHIKIWTKKFEKMLNEEEHEFTISERDQLFRGYRSVTDLPGCTVYQELMHAYPEAKVVLTIRNDASWLTSIRSTVRPRKPHLIGYLFGSIVERKFFGRGFFRMADLSFLAAFGGNVDLSNDDELREAFNAWNNEVKRTVPVDRLLVYEVKNGWEPLCDFLGLPIPDQPFPHVNDAAALQRKFFGIYSVLRIIQFGAFSSLIAMMAFVFRKIAYMI